MFIRLLLLAAFLFLALLGVIYWPNGGNLARNCTLTVNGMIVGDGQRIDLGVVGDAEHDPSPIYLAIANLGPKPLTFTYHSTGPNVVWEFEVNGTVHTFETYGIGSGVHLSRTIQPKQAGVIYADIYYARLSEALKKLVLPPDPRDISFVDAEVRAVLSIYAQSGDGKSQYVKLTSDWAKIRVGFPNYPHSLLPEDSPFR